MKNIKKFSISTHLYQSVLIIFIILCLITGIFCFQFYNQLQSTIRNESTGYLQEISKRIGNNLTRIIDDNYYSLNTFASYLGHSTANSFSDIKPLIETQKTYWSCLDVLLIDESGTAYDSLGNEIALNNDTYFKEAVVNKKQSISTTQMINNKESIMLTVPLNNISIGNKTMVALAATYDPSSFDQTLSMSAFGGQAYSCIISKSGTMIIRSSAKTPMQFGYNILTTIEASKLDEGVSMAKIKTEMADDQFGQIGFTQDGIRYYMVYTPISPDDWYLITFVPTQAVNAQSDMILQITLVLCGLITLVFAGLIAFLLYTSYRNKRKLEQIAYVDDITGGNTIQKFYQLAQQTLASDNGLQYALVYTNLKKFKVLNEQYGREIGDSIIKAFYKNVNEVLTEDECIGRISADNFCFLIRYTKEEDILNKLTILYANAERYMKDKQSPWSLPITEFGVYVIGNEPLPFPQMIDRAKLSLRESPHMINSKLLYGIYNDQVRRQLFREKHLEDMMEDALKQGEFQVYLQPKYQVADSTIGGAEALARWCSSSDGMIYPDEFIPLFEKNGFVIQLDLWVFEEVCRHLRLWLDQGFAPVKISVNCSRVHLKNPDFLERYKEISRQYQIPRGLIEIELTESIVMEDAKRLSKIIDDIHESGFGCSMDDFGSGYSSLNLIQSIPVDTLKLDKIFFNENTQDKKRTESVVRSIVGMAQALSMITVAEGVEHQEQLKMLQKVGCDFVQGYVFAKPMPIDEFEEKAFGLQQK